MHAELNIPDGKDLLAQVGGSLDDRHCARTHDTGHYPRELYLNDKAVRVASGFKTAEKGAAAEEFCINLVRNGHIKGVVGVNIRLKVSPSEHRGASSGRPSGVYLMPVALSCVNSFDDFRKAFTEYKIQHPLKYKHMLQFWGLTKYNLGTDAHSLGIDLYSLGLDKYSKGEDKYSKGEDLFSLGLDKYSKGEDLFSKGEDLYSKGEDLYSKGEDLFSKGEDLFSKGRSMHDEGTSMAKMGTKPGNFGHPGHTVSKPKGATSKLPPGFHGKPEKILRVLQDNFTDEQLSQVFQRKSAGGFEMRESGRAKNLYQLVNAKSAPATPFKGVKCFEGARYKNLKALHDEAVADFDNDLDDFDDLE